jgi:hypothetical protein
MSIVSYVFRKIKKYSINLLEFVSFNSYYSWISIIVLILTWFDLFGVGLSYIINNFIILTWIAGWWYETYKLTKENELLRSVNASLSKYDAENVREDLAALMHDIWADDIIQTDLSLNEQYRASTPYYDLTEDDKQVNLSKADEVLQFISSRRKDNV